MNSGQLVSYDVFKSILLGTIGLTDGMPVHMLSSALAGTVATTISAPADVVRSRVMNMAKGNEQGVVGMITESLRKEGPRFLFKGWLPAWSEYYMPLKDRSLRFMHMGIIEKINANKQSV
jgi:dicarboxylate transporter 10